MSKSEVVYRHSIVGHDSYEVIQFKHAKFKKYGVRYQGASQVFATMDTEEKARMYLDALLQGIGIGEARLNEVRSLIQEEIEDIRKSEHTSEHAGGHQHGLNRALYFMSSSYIANTKAENKSDKIGVGKNTPNPQEQKE